MATKTGWKIEQAADTAHNEYLAVLSETGILDESEAVSEFVERGGVLSTVSASEFVTRARLACKK